jgi:SHS2 domain-containing protein
MNTELPSAKGWKQIPHTADWAIRIWGETPQDVFEQGGKALFELMLDMSRAQTEFGTQLRIESSDPANLLRDFMAELLYLFSADNFVFNYFEFGELTETTCEVLAGGEKFDPEKHPLETEIKAVTFHQLTFEQTDSGYEARVIFDL